MTFPINLDTFSTKVDGVTDVLAADINNLQNAVIALEAAVGVLDSAVTSAHEYRLNSLTLAMFGGGQTWQDVMASRVGGTTYYNTTGKPIAVSIKSAHSSYATPSMSITVDGLVVWYTQLGQSGQGLSGDLAAFTIVPNGSSYSTSGASYWYELR
jgi:hypothetical protein